MRIELSSNKLKSEFLMRVEQLSGQNLLTCYQCGKCSAGCPLDFAMDILPNQIVRLAQIGLEEDILKSKAIWLCASCFTCISRCPKGVDLSKIMEALRHIAMKDGQDRFGPKEIPLNLIKEMPQQGLASLFKKFSV
jgi:heterodisulfide reductase subunit C